MEKQCQMQNEYLIKFVGLKRSDQGFMFNYQQYFGTYCHCYIKREKSISLNEAVQKTI